MANEVIQSSIAGSMTNKVIKATISVGNACIVSTVFRTNLSVSMAKKVSRAGWNGC